MRLVLQQGDRGDSPRISRRDGRTADVDIPDVLEAKHFLLTSFGRSMAHRIISQVVVRIADIHA